MSAMEGAGCAVLNFADDRLRAFGARGDADEVWFSSRQVPPSGFIARDGAIRTVGGELVLEAGALRIPGVHNLENTMAALGAAERLGVPRKAALDAARSFAGVEHRLEFVGERAGVRLFNDSIATTPRSTMAALDALDGPIILLLGGRDSGVDLSQLAERTGERARLVLAFGESKGRVAAALAKASPRLEVVECDDLAAAVRHALDAARAGDAVVLSPAFPSYDQFRNFRERGESFRALAMQPR
jgi:UDP-N-acetylmuramoylalanine--D-glutamate ligase